MSRFYRIRRRKEMKRMIREENLDEEYSLTSSDDNLSL